jgi:hypothetical protein
VGELMARANGYAKRFPGSTVWPGKRWEHSLFLTETNQEKPNYTQLDERASWFYEAVGVTIGMMARTVGAGQVYLESQKDASGAWLDGGKSYSLHIPPNAPVAQFWSFTVYDNESRCFVDTGSHPDRSSRDDIVKNADGSVDLYFGPQPVAGKPEQNWIETLPGKVWLTYFRLYGPTQAYFDKTWGAAGHRGGEVAPGRERVTRAGVESATSKGAEGQAARQALAIRRYSRIASLVREVAHRRFEWGLTATAQTTIDDCVDEHPKRSIQWDAPRELIGHRAIGTIAIEQQRDRPGIRAMGEACDVPERVSDNGVTPIDQGGHPALIYEDVRGLQITVTERPHLDRSQRIRMSVDRRCSGRRYRSGQRVAVGQTAGVGHDGVQEAQPGAVREREATSLVPRGLGQPAEPGQPHLVQATQTGSDLRMRGMPRGNRPADYTIHDEGAHVVVAIEPSTGEDRWSSTAGIDPPSTRPRLCSQRVVHRRCLHDELAPVCVDFIHRVGRERRYAFYTSRLMAKLASHEGRDGLLEVSEGPAPGHCTLPPDRAAHLRLATSPERRECVTSRDTTPVS